MARVTIREIARRSGVSKGAVSYALNGQPGVSATTRARVLKVAEELDWVPNSAARMLSGARTDTVGLVLARWSASPGDGPAFLQFVGGVQRVLAPRSRGLLLQVVNGVADEAAVYRKWASERRVDGVIVVGLHVDDPRVAALGSVDLPAVVAGDPGLAGGLPAVGSEDAAGVDELVGHLVERGHRSIGRVGGPAELVRVRVRDQAFAAAADRAGVRLRTIATDLTGESAADATRRLLEAPERPTAIVYDSDVPALAGLSTLAALGLAVPSDVAVAAWGDSALCRATNPPLTAVEQDLAGYGAAVAQRLLGLLDGARTPAVPVTAPTLRIRASTTS